MKSLLLLKGPSFFINIFAENKSPYSKSEIYLELNGEKTRIGDGLLLEEIDIMMNCLNNINANDFGENIGLINNRCLEYIFSPNADFNSKECQNIWKLYERISDYEFIQASSELSISTWMYTIDKCCWLEISSVIDTDDLDNVVNKVGVQRVFWLEEDYIKEWRSQINSIFAFLQSKIEKNEFWE